MFKLTLLLMCALISSVGAAIKIASDVPTPRNVLENVSGGTKLTDIHNSLSQATLESYYKNLSNHLGDCFGKAKAEWDEHDLAHFLWSCYYVTAGPLYIPDYTEEDIGGPRFIDDYTVKYETVCTMRSFIVWLNDDSEVKKIRRGSKKRLTELCVVYMVRMMKDMRGQYDPNWSEKRNELMNIYIKHEIGEPNLQEDVVDMSTGLVIPKRVLIGGRNRGLRYSGPPFWSGYAAKLNNIGFRNGTAKTCLDYSMEPDFVESLVVAYPSNATAVKRAIKEAGYTEEEMDDLIDRTVGCTAKTEYLYKGRKEDKPPKKSKDKDNS